jgi:hypothetical protein
MARPLKLNRIRVHPAGTRRRDFGVRKDATGLPAPPFRVEQTYVEANTHAGLEHVTNRGP